MKKHTKTAISTLLRRIRICSKNTGISQANSACNAGGSRMRYVSPLCVSVLFFLAFTAIMTGPALAVTIIDQNSYWRYTFSPNNDWNTINYDSSSWDIGIAPFSNGATGGQDTCPSGIEKFTGFPLYKTLYARCEFYLDKIPKSGKLYVGYDNDLTAYLNGNPVVTKTHDGCGAYWNDEISLSGFTIGKNVIVCVVEDRGGSSFFDAKLTAEGLNTNDFRPITQANS